MVVRYTALLDTLEGLGYTKNQKRSFTWDFWKIPTEAIEKIQVGGIL